MDSLTPLQIVLVVIGIIAGGAGLMWLMNKEAKSLGKMFEIGMDLQHAKRDPIGYLASHADESERKYIERLDHYILSRPMTLSQEQFKRAIEEHFPDYKEKSEYPKNQTDWANLYGNYLDLKRIKKEGMPGMGPPPSATSNPLNLPRR